MKNKDPENDIPKYKKKTKSNCSKSKSKSDHKHKNKDCLLIADGKPYLASYCTVCGKICTTDNRIIKGVVLWEEMKM